MKRITNLKLLTLAQLRAVQELIEASVNYSRLNEGEVKEGTMRLIEATAYASAGGDNGNLFHFGVTFVAQLAAGGFYLKDVREVMVFDSEEELSQAATQAQENRQPDEKGDVFPVEERAAWGDFLRGL